MPLDAFEPAAGAGSGGARRWHSLAAVMASALAVGLTVGMAAPLITLGLNARGYDALVVGLNAATAALAMFAIGPWVPLLMGRLGTVPAMVGGLLLSAGCLALFPFTESLFLWFLLRLLLGVGMTVHWVISETWINRLARGADRGRAVGAYGTLWTLGIALGPLVLSLVGTEGALPYAVCAALLASATLPLLGARRTAPELTGERHQGSWQGLLAAAPLAFGAAFLSGVTETALFSLLPLYGLQLQMSEGAVTAMLTAIGAGGVLMQLPLGWAADRLGRERVLRLAVGGGIAGAVLLAPASGNPLTLWPLLFLWGGAISGYYTLALAAIGDRFDRSGSTVSRLAAANVVCVMAYNLGTLIGPVASGVAFDLWPPHGLPATLGGLFSLYLLLAWWWRRRPA